MHRALVFALLASAAATLAPAAGFAGSCSPTATRLCLHDSRFGVEVAWAAPEVGSGVGHASPLTNDTGLFWFFKDSNLELVVKVLDARAVNGHFWVYYGGLSDVEYTITVTDTRTGDSEIYHNPASQLASGADTSAFTEEPLATSGQIRFGMLGGAPATAADATAATATAAIPQRQGSELQANVTTAGGQQSPDVAIGADGGSMVVWSGPSPEDFTRMDIYGRFFDAGGNPRGGEIRLNDNRFLDQPQIRVAAAPGGGYMTVWQDNSLLKARVFGADGQPLGGEIKVSSSHGPQLSPAIAAADGGFVVVWADGSPIITGDPVTAIVGQRFNAQGGRVGNLFSIGGPSEDLREPHLAASPAGGFVATWIEPRGTGETDVLAQRLDAMSQPLGDPLRVNIVDSNRVPGHHQGALPIFHADGSFSVLWTTSLLSNRAGTDGMFARRYSAAGAALSDVVEVRRGLFPQAPATALLPSGDVLVLWTEEGRPADPDGGILARLFDSSWTPRGPEFRVNTFTLLPQTEPAVASDASGRLLAVWSSGLDTSQGTPPFPGFVDDSQDGSGFGVFGQRFTTATCALTPDQLCLSGRFRVGVQFTSPWSGVPEAGHALPLTSDTGAFWFFSEDNVELTIKVLDGRAINGRFWVYAGALSDVDYTITITDTQTGKVKTYHNDQGHLTSRADVEAF